MRVLVVDDDKLARKGLISIMNWEKYGFEVVGDVQNGSKALEFLKDNMVDVVFTDIDMPEIDGIELMERCRTEYPDVKFVIFSVHEDFRYAQKAMRLGALDYISKISFDGDDCDQILERVDRKYKDNLLKKEKRQEDHGLRKKLENAWMNTRWIYDDNEFGRLCEMTGEAKLFQPLVIGTDIWKGFGYNTVVYLAAILGVDKSLYEAAAADGAGRFKRIWHVTLPGIRTTVALLAILSLGNVLNAGFDQIYNLYNPLVYSTGDVIDTWVYRAGLQNLQYSLATAVGLFKSVISVILIALGYRLADKFTGYKLF